MSVAGLKFLNRNGVRALRLPIHNFVRRTSTDDPCSPKQPEPCSQPPKPKEPCPSKAEFSQPPPPTPTSPDPPPCPPMPHCPPTICPPTLSSHDPCNYTPPPCPDPDDFDITKLKKLQCLFQSNPDVPLHLRRGAVDAFLYQAIITVIAGSFIYSLYTVYMMSK